MYIHKYMHAYSGYCTVGLLTSPSAPMVERKKKNTLEKVIENLTKDEATLEQLLETSGTIRQPHQVWCVWCVCVVCVCVCVVCV